MEAPIQTTPPDLDSTTSGTSVTWAAGALLLTTIVGILAKTLGVLVAPGMRGIAQQRAMESTEVATGALGYTFAGLLVALVCGGSFELARVRKVPVAVRAIVVAISGLVVALASPSVVGRLQVPAALALAFASGLVVIVGGAAALRSAQTRLLGAVLVFLALSGLVRPAAWLVAWFAGEHASLSLYHLARAIATSAVVFQGLATLLAAAWLGTRSRWRGRVLANLAIVIAFLVTYLAAREGETPPSSVEAVLRGSLNAAGGVPAPYGLSSIAAFLVPASILLAGVALAQHPHPAAILCSLALALLSQGSFDVPLQALAAAAAAQWALLGMADERALWTALTRPAADPPDPPPAPELRPQRPPQAAGPRGATSAEGSAP